MVGVCGQLRKLKTIHHCSISAQHTRFPFVLPRYMLWLLCPFMLRFATFKVKPISFRSSMTTTSSAMIVVWCGIKGGRQTPCLGNRRTSRCCAAGSWWFNFRRTWPGFYSASLFMKVIALGNTPYSSSVTSTNQIAVK